jgi:hypothetical protein
MRATGKLLTAIGVLLVFASKPASAQREVGHPADPWVHEATGTRFPATVGAFQRGRVIEYSPDGRDASAAYHLTRGGAQLTVTLYVYPTIAALDCEETFEDAKRSIESYRGSRAVFEGFDPPPSGRGAGMARQARYLIPAGAINSAIPEVLTELYLYCPAGHEWLVKYRASWDADADFAPDIDALMETIEWPGNLGG